MKEKTRLSINGAARVWGMSERTLRRRIESGLIEAVSTPTSRSRRAGLLIEAATLDALLAARWCSKEDEVALRFAQEGAAR